MVFRLYYYVIPLFLAGTLFAGNEILLRGGCCCAALGRSAGVQALARWSEPDFAVASATGLVALCGGMLLCVGVLAPQPDFSWIDPDFAEMATQAGQFIPSLIGAGLIVLAIGLSHRVTWPGVLTILLLVAGAAFTATQGERLWIAGVLVLTAMLVAPLRSCFYRHASLLSGPLEPASAISLFALVICILALAVTRSDACICWRTMHGGQVIMSREMPNSLRLTVALAVVLALLAIWRLLRPGRVRWLPWDATARQRLADAGRPIPPARADGMVMGEAERAGIPFRRCGRVLLGLGDPMRCGGRPRLRDLAIARPGTAGGIGSSVLAGRAGAAEGLWRSGSDRFAARGGWAADAGVAGHHARSRAISRLQGGTRSFDVAAAVAAVGDQQGFRAGGGLGRVDNALPGWFPCGCEEPALRGAGVARNSRCEKLGDNSTQNARFVPTRGNQAHNPVR